MINQTEPQVAPIAPASASASPAAPEMQPSAWQHINPLPYADDLVWLRHGDSIEGPRPMGTDDYDRFSEWAPCEPPSFSAAPVAGSQQVPQGWKFVPVEPTEEMDAAARAECHRMQGVIDPVIHVWDAMLAAAPAVPVPAEQPIIGKLLDEMSQLEMLWGLNEPGALVRFADVSKVLFTVGRATLQPKEGAASE